MFEAGAAGGFLYIVMEFVDGTDVARMIQHEGKLAPELAMNLLLMTRAGGMSQNRSP